MGDPGVDTKVPLVNEPDFGFGFNDRSFSDRVLHIEIMYDSLDSKSESQGSDGVPNRKRMREYLEEENGGEAENSNDSEYSPVVAVKTLHISSIILAAKSPFFFKLFKNGMVESQQRDATLKINASEEASLMEVLKFMYYNTLSTLTAPELVDVLILADKFEVTSCVSYCTKMMQTLPMSLESALSYLELPSNVVFSEAVKPLIDSTKQYLIARYRDMTKSHGEAMTLPLSAVEIILSSDTLQVRSEDAIFDFVLKWARLHYPKKDERREILAKNLLRLIRFPYLSCLKLKEVQVCPDLDHEQVCKHVSDALFFKADGRRSSRDRDLSAANSGFVERFYRAQPVKIVRFGLSRPRCVIYFELKKEDCADLFQNRSRLLVSEVFRLGARKVLLQPLCHQEQRTSVYHFGVAVFVDKDSGGCKLDCGISVMKKPSEEFQSMFKVNNFTLLLHCNMLWIGKSTLVPWAEFMSDNSDYFIDGILHLRVELTLKD